MCGVITIGTILGEPEPPLTSRLHFKAAYSAQMMYHRIYFMLAWSVIYLPNRGSELKTENLQQNFLTFCLKDE